MTKATAFKEDLRRITLKAAVLFAACGTTTALYDAICFAQDITPEPIALPASEFPVPTSQLDSAVTRNDIAALRDHAWTLWAGVTADSRQSLSGRSLPIWETWLSEEEAFASPGRVAANANRARVLIPLAAPRQFEHGAPRDTRRLTSAIQSGSSAALLASVKMSPDAVNFLSQQHQTPANSGHPYSYKSAADIARLNADFDQNNTLVKDRKIIDFPAAAIDLKLVFLPVKANAEVSPIPVWGGPAASNVPDSPTPDTWTNCVAVDPRNKLTGTRNINCNAMQIEAPVIPINDFFWIQLDAERAGQINNDLNLKDLSAVSAGDYAVLVAMHITTKEIANWTWATFWWQNGQNPPNNFPGTVDGMPNSSKIKGPWRKFAMCISDAEVTPATDPHGKPVVCFNPYLETSQTDGLNSNCMSCHAMARLPVKGSKYPLTYLPNGWIDPGDPGVFGSATQLDFVWAIQQSAH